MAFNRVKLLDFQGADETEEAAAEREMRMMAQQRQAELIRNRNAYEYGKAPGERLGEAMSKMPQAYGQGLKNRNQRLTNQQAERDEVRDEARLDAEFRDEEDPAYHSEMPSKAQRIMGRGGYKYRRPEDGGSAPAPGGTQDMTTLEGRGQYFEELPARPNYMNSEGFPEQPSPRPPVGEDIGSRLPAEQPSAAPPSRQPVDPRGFPMTGPDTGYTVPDRNYSPGAADVLDGKAQPGFNPGYTVNSPYQNNPGAQLPPLTEEEMEMEQLKKKDDIPGTVDSGRWGKGLGNQILTPEEQAAVNESWRQEDERLAAEATPVGSYPHLKKEYFGRLAQLAMQQPVDRMTASTGAERITAGYGFNVLQASHFSKLRQERERLRGMQLDNLNKMYGPPLSEADVLSAQDRALKTGADLELKERDLEIKEIEIALKQEERRAKLEGYEKTGQISDDGYMIYADRFGKEVKGQVKVRDKKTASQRRKVGQTPDGKIIYDDPELGEVVGETPAIVQQPPGTSWQVVPNTDTPNVMLRDPKDPSKVADSGIPQKKTPVKDPLPPSARQKLKGTITDNTNILSAFDEQIREWEKTAQMVQDYNKGEHNPGSGLMGQALGYAGGLAPKTQALNQRFSKASFDEIVSKMQGMSKAIDSNAERRAFQSAQPHLGLDDDVLASVVQQKIDALRAAKQRHEFAIQAAKDQLAEADHAMGKGGAEGNSGASTVVRKQHNKKLNKTRITYSDGRVEEVDGLK